MANHRYRVLRPLVGDKPYGPGDERIAAPAEVAHLVPHALEDLGPDDSDGGEKSEAAPANKAEPAPANKAAKPARRRSKKDKS